LFLGSLQMEHALENLDALVYELSIFGNDEEEEEEQVQDEQEEEDSLQKISNEVCEMNANGVFDLTSASGGNGRPQKISSKLGGKNKNSRKQDNKHQGNHVDMAALARSLLSKVDDAYDLNQLRQPDGREKRDVLNQMQETSGHIGRSKRLVTCKLCSKHLLNHSYTLHCKCSFHPQCIVGAVGNKLMEGQEPKCPQCFQPIE